MLIQVLFRWLIFWQADEELVLLTESFIRKVSFQICTVLLHVIKLSNLLSHWQLVSVLGDLDIEEEVFVALD